jgi:hypothetical protein
MRKTVLQWNHFHERDSRSLQTHRSEGKKGFCSVSSTRETADLFEEESGVSSDSKDETGPFEPKIEVGKIPRKELVRLTTGDKILDIWIAFKAEMAE